MDMPIKYFLGANTAVGFVGYAEETYDADDGWRMYLIKSGPGTGKSSLMRKLYERMMALGVEGEVFSCSSDPSSLDGVRFPSLKMGMLDATAPHVTEPQFWGAVEQIVPLSVCMDEEKLHGEAEKIVLLTRQNRALHARVRQYIHAASAMLRENRRIAEAAVDVDKVRRLAARTARQEFGTADGDGRVTHRFLSAVTPQGVLTEYGTLQALCPRIYSIEDEDGAASRLFLEELLRHALATGADAVVCPCPLSPHDGAEHLLFPSLGVGFTTSNEAHKVDFPVYRRIHATRFTEAEAMSARRQRMSFNRRAARELLEQASATAAEAKAVHDAMEAYSIAAMDWAHAEAMGNALIDKFEAALRP